MVAAISQTCLSGRSGCKRGWVRTGQHGSCARRLPAYWPILNRYHHFSEEYAALYRNDGDLNFTDVSHASGIAQSTTSYVGWGDAFFDLDNDGWPDFFMVNGHVYPQVKFRGNRHEVSRAETVIPHQHNGNFRNISQDAGPAIQIPQVSRGLRLGIFSTMGDLNLLWRTLKVRQ